MLTPEEMDRIAKAARDLADGAADAFIAVGKALAQLSVSINEINIAMRNVDNEEEE